MNEEVVVAVEPILAYIEVERYLSAI